MQCLPPWPQAARDGVDKVDFCLASTDQCGKARAPPNLGRGYGGQQVLSVHNNILVHIAYHSLPFRYSRTQERDTSKEEVPRQTLA
ncbi:uncharacterized [Tachysurus ichikawai]